MPPSANLATVFAVFIGLLLVFHALLVRWLKLGSVAWKRMDYVWLGFGALGLFSAVSQVRTTSASVQLDMYERRAVGAFESVKSLVAWYALEPGAVCRTFVRSELSPPPEEFQRVQDEFAIACRWAKEANKVLVGIPASPPKRLDPASLPTKPAISDSAFKEIFPSLDSQLKYFDESIDALSDLRVMSGQSSLDYGLIDFGPFLLAFALAIRITKVTGELRLKT